MKRRVNRQSMIIKPPFEQRANDAKSFRDMHPGIEFYEILEKCCIFNFLFRKPLLFLV